MCEISAIFRFEGDAGADLAELDRMHRAQRHRGPDGRGPRVRSLAPRPHSLLRNPAYQRAGGAQVHSDRNAIAHSVEAHIPYLDHRIVELCFSLPASHKVGFGRRKLLLFRTAKHYLPVRGVASKKKRRFVLMNNWMPLRDKHADALRDAHAARHGPNSPMATRQS
jgi:asparagine synthetase B (glutamine-hydrolysing)